jgi:long-chain acyl-CoA synthetase
MNVGQILRQGALRFPDRIAVVDVGHPEQARREFAFAELDELARGLAAALAARGVSAGDSVALIGENSAEFVAAWFAIAYAGCSVVPIPTLSAAPELRYRIEHAGCRAVLCDAAREALVRASIVGLPGPPLCLEIARTSRGAPPALALPQDTAPDAHAMILYTSGTSGNAKGAAISHAALLMHTAVLALHTLQLSAEDRVLGVLPLTHSYGWRMGLLVALFVGARSVLVPRFDAARTLALLDTEAITWLPAVPTMFAAWAAQSGGAPPPALRWALCAGAPLADETTRRAELRLGTSVRQGYGMTEATFCTINAPPDPRVFGSVGRPVWGIEVRLLDAAGADVAPGQSGEVAVRGHNAMTHYLHEPGTGAGFDSAGFFRSGDVGRFDDHGRLMIVDRIKDLIIRGGYNVYPAEVEAALAMHADVSQVAVVGRPDPYYGEEVVAVVIRRAGTALDAATLLAWARARISRSKQPREVVFVDAFPLGPSGKVQKRSLRQALLEGTLSEAEAAGTASGTSGTAPGNTPQGPQGHR